MESETYGAAKAAIVTGGSSGIGLAIARILAAEGYGLTVVARRAERLERAAARLRADGADVQAVTAQVGQEEAVRRVVSAHRQRFGRLDVLVNNAGAGFMAPVSGITTSQLDTQIAVNLRSMVLFYRETVGMLRAAAGEHGSATVFNTSSAVASTPPPLFSVYSATKAAVIAFSSAMNAELGADGVRTCVLIPGYVDTPMTEWARGDVPQDSMLQPGDIAEAVRCVLRAGPGCVVPELRFMRPGGII